MGAYLLHQGATVQCQHAGNASPVVPSQRVKVAGQAVVTQSTSYTVAGCPHTVGNSPSPCTTARWVTAATRVKVGGEAMMLQDSRAVCTPNGTGVTIVSTQARVRGT